MPPGKGVLSLRLTVDATIDPLACIVHKSQAICEQCRLPIGLEALRKAGRSWEIVYDCASLSSVQAAVEADLGLSILSPLCLVPGIEIAGKKAELPPLPTSDLALYSRKSPLQPAVQRLASFIANAVSRWENNARQADGAGSH